MTMVGFLQAKNCINLASSWRHPENWLDRSTANYNQEISRVLEQGKFHLGSLDDRLACPINTATT